MQKNVAIQNNMIQEYLYHGVSYKDVTHMTSTTKDPIMSKPVVGY